MHRILPIVLSTAFTSVLVGLNSDSFAASFDSPSQSSEELVACGGGAGGGGGSGAKKRAARAAMLKELQEMRDAQEDSDND